MPAGRACSCSYPTTTQNSEAARMVQFNLTQKARVHDQEVDGRDASQRKQPIEAEHRAALNIATPGQRQPQDRLPAMARLVQTVDDAAHGALARQESTHRTRPGPRSTKSADANRANWPAQAKLVLRIAAEAADRTAEPHTATGC